MKRSVQILMLSSLTGVSALMMQATWQRYLSITLGSEARSLTLTIAMFLTGLSLGYFYWGKSVEKWKQSKLRFQNYGLIELGIALWACSFPYLNSFWFKQLEWLPNNILTDLFIAGSTIVPATFLMGASIPCLTRLLPRTKSEVHRVHFSVYGINTIAATSGVAISYLYFIPQFGLLRTSLLAASLNFIVGIYCFFSKSLMEQEWKEENKKANQSVLESSGDKPLLHALALISGIVTLAFEIVLFRVVGLSIGMNSFVTPLVLSIFLFWLGMGSLSKLWIKSSWNNLVLALAFSILGLSICYYTIPYWSVWFNYIYTPDTIEHKLDIYTYILKVAGILFLILSLPLISLGQLLPSAFGLMKASLQSPGQSSGILFALNTLGTIIGSVFLGYVLLYLLNIDDILRICIFIIIVFGLITYSLKRTQLKVITKILSFLCLISTILIFTKWNRYPHAVGLFRDSTRAAIQDSGLFAIPEDEIFKVEYLEDGPNTTVSVVSNRFTVIRGQAPKVTETIDLSLMVNGKSDGNSRLDFSTMSLASSVPYLYMSPQKRSIKSLIIGLGTGISAGYMAKFPDIESIDVLEISPMAIRALPHFDRFNHAASKSNKIKIHETDAFRHLIRSKDKYDIIMSEPSTLWVLGVENLFTREYYRHIRKNLKDDGVFFQWIHPPGVSPSSLVSVLRNLTAEFPYIESFEIGHSDVGFLASLQPLSAKKERFEKEFLRKEIFNKLYIPSFDHFQMIRLFDRDYYVEAVRKMNPTLHTLNTPRLSHNVMMSTYLRENASIPFLVHADVRRDFNRSKIKSTAFRSVARQAYDAKNDCNAIDFGHSLPCARIWLAKRMYNDIISPKIVIPITHLNSYAELRDLGYIEKDINFLERVAQKVQDKRSIAALVRELTRDQEHSIARNVLTLALEKGYIDSTFQARLLKGLNDAIARQSQVKFLKDQEQD